MPYTVETLKMMRTDELKSLLKNKKIDQTLNHDGYNLLHAIVETVARHKEFIPLVLAYDVDINAQDRRTGSYHNTPLHILIANELPEGAIFLIDEANHLNKPLNFNIQDKEGKTPLLLAVKTLQHSTVGYILKQKQDGATVNVNLADSAGMTPLHYACAYGSLDMVQALVAAGANISAQNSIGRIPLDLIATTADNIKTFFQQVAIDAERDEAALSNHIRDKNGEWPLMLREVLMGRQEYQHIPAKKINEYARDLDTMLEQGILDTTACALHFEVRPMLDKTDKAYLSNQFIKMSGRSLLDSCQAGQIAVRNWLIDQGSAFDWLIRFAAANNNIPHLEQLLAFPQAKLYVNVPGQPSGKKALHNAAMKGHDQVIEVLLNAGVPINTLDNDRNTALHLAITQKHLKVAVALVRNGADLTIGNKDGITAADLLTKEVYAAIKTAIEELVDQRPALRC